MQSVILAGAIQAVFLIFLILTKRNKTKADFVLIFFLIITAVPLFFYYFIYDDVYEQLLNSHLFPNFLYFVNMPFLMSFMPMIYIYVKANFYSGEKFFKRNIIHFLPVITFIFFTFLWVDFSQVRQNGFFSLNRPVLLIFLLYAPLTVILAVFYVYKSFRLIRKYTKRIKENFSYTEDIELTWLKILLLIVVISWLILLPVSFFLGKAGNVLLVYQIVLVSVAFLVFVLAFFGFRQSSVFDVKTNKSNGKTLLVAEEKQNQKTFSANKEDIDFLLNYMEKEKPYLEYKLTLSELASKLGWSAQYLSKLLNKDLKKNFYEFVNFYRVEEVKKRLREDSKYTILAIAFECGFNSKSSFHRIFKEFTGKTPNEYKKEVAG